ncbi:13989_t:CDS:2 [Funneliformis mosseae]|uniref:13989_t:CDS:1 n=1 Tax=Funneliformis mosseae TaxID=27381 RepID=A0A9N9H1N2_FUNMO|nr:13989_t:CDS:2 [Funneliformis mosseae]
MLDTNDQMLTDLQPSMKWNDWIKDLKKVIDDSSYHLDEIFKSDNKKAQEEKDKKIRPFRNENSNHIIHVYNKK